MPQIKAHRKCGCDCRDQDTFVQDPQLVSPSCCASCPGGQKPPCCYVAHMPCRLTYQGELLTYSGGYINNGVNAYQLVNNGYATALQNNIFLRPICEFQNACVFRSLVYNRYQEVSSTGISPYSGHNTACTWSERLEGYATQAEINALARWSLDITTGVFTHPCGIRYALPTGTAWNCYGPNTLVLACPPTNQRWYGLAQGTGGNGNQPCVDWSIAIPGLPKTLCITPAISTRIAQDACCKNCFKFDLPAGNTAHIPAQTITFLPVQNLNATGGACGYEASVIDDGSASGISIIYGDSRFSSMFLRVATPMNTGLASQAQISFTYANNGTGGVVYTCNSLTCSGGTFTFTSGDTSFPPTITLTATKCIWPENDNQGPCPAICGTETANDGGSDGSAGHQGDYITEALRCGCCDPFCDCIPGELKIFCGTHVSRYKTCPDQSGAVNGVKWCKGGRTGVGSHGGPSREACFGIYDTTNTFHTICVVIYCTTGSAWQIDWYCDGTYVSTNTGAVTCCPLTIKATMPTISCLSGCTGCIGVNTTADCVAVDNNCCPLANFNNTMVAHFVSTCLGTFSITITKAGTTWTGSGVDAFGDPVTVKFLLTMAPCHLTIEVNNSGLSATITLTVVSCTPPSFTGSITSSIAGSGCTIFDTTAVSLS